MLSLDDTIGAIASPPGGAIRGVVRISGPDVIHCLQHCFSAAEGDDLQQVRTASVLPGLLHVPPPVGDLECDLYLWPDQRSFTRQPAAELHTFGSPPLLEAALHTLCAAGVRLAEPGEFTMRAFLAGRLDLTQAEAVLGVIDAQSGSELRVALSQMAGGLATPLNDLRRQLMDLLAHLEAGLDFAEEEIEFLSSAELESCLSAAAGHVSSIEARLVEREQREDMPRVVLMGWPNVGKSSLFNALAGDRAAIVSRQAGTTRDYVTRTVKIAGREFVLIDTAGVKTGDAENTLAAASQVVREAQDARADLRLLCLDATRPLNAWEETQISNEDAPHRLVVLTKTDAAELREVPSRGIRTSSVTGDGLDELRRTIFRCLESLPGRELLAVANTATRCRESLRRTARRLQSARDLVVHGRGEELVAAEIRLALEELGKIVGAVYTDDILDRVFSRFCIGK
ncbi:MAG: tRNA modification GTPase [Pirellulaceae bacterium]